MVQEWSYKELRLFCPLCFDIYEYSKLSIATSVFLFLLDGFARMGYNCYEEYDSEYDSGPEYSEYSNDSKGMNSDDIEAPETESYEYPISEVQFYKRVTEYVDFVTADLESIFEYTSRVQEVKKQMNWVFSRKQVLLCIELTVGESNPSKLIEVGVAIYDPRYQELALIPHVKTFFARIIENEDVEDRSFWQGVGRCISRNYCPKKSRDMSTRDAVHLLQRLIHHYFSEDFEMHCSIVGHDLKNLFEKLNNLRLSVPHNARKLDTKRLFSDSHGCKDTELNQCLDRVKESHSYLNSAGNRAYYTVILALKLCDPDWRQVNGFDYEKDSDENCVEILFKSLI